MHLRNILLTKMARDEEAAELTRRQREMNKKASIEYRGKTFPGYNQPIDSDKKDKKKMVLVKKGDRVKVVHYGQKGYQHNYSESAKKNYLTRSAGIRNKDGQLTKNDPFSPNYWARKDLWPSRKPADGKALSGLKKEAASSSELASLRTRGIVQRVPYKTRETIYRKLLNVLTKDKPKSLKQLKAALQSQFPGLNIKPFLASMLKAKAVKVKGSGFVKTANEGEYSDSHMLSKVLHRMSAQSQHLKDKIDSGLVLPSWAEYKLYGAYDRLSSVLGAAYPGEYSKEAAVATKTDPALWEKSKAEAKARMGGKHSARAMQLATQIYKKKGGGYSGAKPTSQNNSLKKWTKQKWTTPSGAKSKDTGEVYLPSRRIKHLMKTESGRKGLSMATAIKREGYSKGQQYTSHGLASGTSLKKTASVLDTIESSKNFNGLHGANWGE